MDDFESKLNAIFSSPESMEQIRNLAKSLSGGGGEAALPPPELPFTDSQPDPRIMQMITRVMGEYAKPSDSTAILSALRPYLSGDRAKKLDRAMNIAKLARIAKTILPEFGGDKHV